jgi:hypothetical protein
MKWRAITCLFAFLMAGPPAAALRADVAPVAEEELERPATLVLEGPIEGMRIGREPSEFEPGVGNTDWGIYLTLGVEKVVKGSTPDDSLEARCFRLRQRRSLMEILTPSGHHPIPPVGTRVRAYLNGDSGAWRVVLPNGILVLDGFLEDAPEVRVLATRGFTLGLPLELWAAVLVAGLAGAALVRLARRRSAGEAGCGDSPEVQQGIYSPTP